MVSGHFSNLCVVKIGTHICCCCACLADCLNFCDECWLKYVVLCVAETISSGQSLLLEFGCQGHTVCRLHFPWSTEEKLV